MILDGLWDLNLDLQLTWFWEHLLNRHLDIPLSCFLAWHFEITLAHDNAIWFEFYLANWLY